MKLLKNMTKDLFVCMLGVSEYKSMDVSKEIYYSVPFLAFKMATIVHTGGRVENCQIGQNCQSVQKFLLTMVGGKRLVGCGQISLASNSKANSNSQF